MQPHFASWFIVGVPEINRGDAFLVLGDRNACYLCVFACPTMLRAVAIGGPNNAKEMDFFLDGPETFGVVGDRSLRRTVAHTEGWQGVFDFNEPGCDGVANPHRPAF